MEEKTPPPTYFDFEEGYRPTEADTETEGESQETEDEGRIEDAEDDEGDGSHYEGDFR